MKVHGMPSSPLHHRWTLPVARAVSKLGVQLLRRVDKATRLLSIRIDFFHLAQLAIWDLTLPRLRIYDKLVHSMDKFLQNAVLNQSANE